MGPKRKKEAYDSSSDASSKSDSSQEKRSKAKKKEKRPPSSSESEGDERKASKRDGKPRRHHNSSPETESKRHKPPASVDVDREEKYRRRKQSAPEEDRPHRQETEMDHRVRHEDRHHSGEGHRSRHEGHRERDGRDRERGDRRDERDYRSRREEDRNRSNRGRFNNSRGPYRRRFDREGSFDHTNAKWGKESYDDKAKERKGPAEKPNFGLSGKLTEETNTYKGVVIKYSEPPEARKAKRRWRLYPFKGEKALQTLYIHRESAYLIGRDRKVVDLPVDHPSCSKQHAALQYRLVPFTRDDGSTGKRVRPYLIDLESANGTYINNKRIDSKKYVELLEKDVIKFGYSSREYVLLHENSKDEAQDDDVKQEEEEMPVVKEEAAE